MGRAKNKHKARLRSRGELVVPEGLTISQAATYLGIECGECVQEACYDFLCDADDKIAPGEERMVSQILINWADHCPWK